MMMLLMDRKKNALKGYYNEMDQREEAKKGLNGYKLA